MSPSLVAVLLSIKEIGEQNFPYLNPCFKIKICYVDDDDNDDGGGDELFLWYG